MPTQNIPKLGLKIKDLHLHLNSTAGAVHILNGINLSIGLGETIGVMGTSGSGKTSLLMVIAGLEPASQGHIEINGQLISNMKENQLTRFRRNNIGIIFQNFHLVPTMTAIENIALPLEFGGCKNAFRIAAESLNSVNLCQRANHYPAQLSGGEQQRIAIARAFSIKPSILLADEPTGSLDKKTGSKIMELLLSLNKEHNATMIIVTHSPTLAKQCDRLVYLADGQIATSNVQ
mgnify:CR=1 FL=1